MSKKLFHYVANCTDSFDPKNGDCLNHLFSDVSEFGRLEGDFWDAQGEGERDLLTREEFDSLVDFPDFLKEKSLSFYNFEGFGNRPEILVAYDNNEDIHYFFAK